MQKGAMIGALRTFTSWSLLIATVAPAPRPLNANSMVSPFNNRNVGEPPHRQLLTAADAAEHTRIFGWEEAGVLFDGNRSVSVECDMPVVCCLA